MKESQHQFICVVQIIFPAFIFLFIAIATLFPPHTKHFRYIDLYLYLVHTHTQNRCYLTFFVTLHKIQEKFIHWQNDAQLYAFSFFFCVFCVGSYGFNECSSVFFCVCVFLSSVSTENNYS